MESRYIFCFSNVPYEAYTAMYIYIYAFSRRFYPKRLTLHSSYSFYILSALAFPGNRTHDLGVASAMLYHLSYRKAVPERFDHLIFTSKKSVLKLVLQNVGYTGASQ